MGQKCSCFDKEMESKLEKSINDFSYSNKKDERDPKAQCFWTRQSDARD